MKLVFSIVITILSITYLLYLIVPEGPRDNLDKVFIEIASPPTTKRQSTSRPTSQPTSQFGLNMNRMLEAKQWLVPIKSPEVQQVLFTAFIGLFHENPAKRNKEGAKQNLDIALEKDPNNAVAYRLLGYYHISNGFNIEEALKCYQKAVELEPKYGEAHYALAFSLVTKDLKKAEKSFIQAMELGVDDERNLAKQYFENVDMSKYKKKKALGFSFSKSRQQELATRIAPIKNPKIKEALQIAFAALFSSQKKLDEAKTKLDYVLQIEPKNPIAYRLLGYYYISYNFQSDLAVQQYKKAIELDPNYGEAHYALSFALVTSDVPLGRKHFIQALQLGVEDERNLATQYYKDVDVKHYFKAKTAQEHNHHDHEGHDHEGHNHQEEEKPTIENSLSSTRQKEFKEKIQIIADKEVQKALSIAFLCIFHQDKTKRNPQVAKESLDWVLTKDPKNAVAHRIMGYFHISNGFRIQEAIQSYYQAIQFAPNYGEVHYALAFSLARANLKEGEKHFIKAMELGVTDERNLSQKFYTDIDMSKFKEKK